MSKTYQVFSTPRVRLSNGQDFGEGETFPVFAAFADEGEAAEAARREAVRQVESGKRGLHGMRDHDDDAVVVFEYGITYNSFTVCAFDDELDDGEGEDVFSADAFGVSPWLCAVASGTERDGSFWDTICWASEAVDDADGYQLVDMRGMYGDTQCLRTVSIPSEILLPAHRREGRFETVAEALAGEEWAHWYDSDAPDAKLAHAMLEELVAC